MVFSCVEIELFNYSWNSIVRTKRVAISLNRDCFNFPRTEQEFVRFQNAKLLALSAVRGVVRTATKVCLQQLL